MILYCSTLPRLLQAQTQKNYEIFLTFIRRTKFFINYRKKSKNLLQFSEKKGIIIMYGSASPV